jgi:hypothetical protein
VTPDLRLHDADQHAEIELYGTLVIAASDHDGPLSAAEIDAALGLATPSVTPSATPSA